MPVHDDDEPLGPLDHDDDELGPDEWPPTPQRVTQPTAQRNRDVQQWSHAKNIALAKAVSANNPYIAEHGTVTATWAEVQNDMNDAGYNIKRTDTLRKHMDELLVAQRVRCLAPMSILHR